MTKHYQKFFLIIVLLIILQPECEAKYFQQYNYGIRIQLPDSWECVAESSDTFLAVFVAPEMKHSLNTLTLAHQVLPAGMVLKDYVQKAVQQYEKVLPLYRLQSQDWVYDNPFVPYYLLTYTWEPAADCQIFVMQMFVWHHSEVLIFTCCAPLESADFYKETFLRMFNQLALMN